MEQSRTRIKKLNSKDDFLYAARQYKDYCIAKEIENDLKVMVYAILGSKKNLEIKSSDTPTGFKVGGIDRKYKWFGYVKPDGYMFFGDSEIELYCKIIASIVGNRSYLPFSY